MARKIPIQHISRGPAAGNQPGLSDLKTQAVEDRTKQLGREGGAIEALKQAMALIDEDYGKGLEHEALSAANAKNILGGLGGSTVQGAVSGGLSAKFKDLQTGRMGEALKSIASFLGSYRDPTMATPGMVLQETGQNQQFLLGQQRLNAANRTPTRTSFTPGPVSLAKPAQPAQPASSSFASQTSRSGNNISGGIPPAGYNALGSFDPAAANARLGNTLQPAAPSGDNWFNWQDSLSFEGLNFG